MPLIRLETSVAPAEDVKQDLLKSLSSMIASAIGKPEQYVMAELSGGAFLMAGEGGDAAFADIRSIGGLNGTVNAEIADLLCTLLKEKLGVRPDRVYINFTDVSAAQWGWNGNTFG